jgi:hypothetical protein
MDSYTDEEIAAAAERARLRALSTPDPVALPKLPQVKPDEKKPKKQGPGRGTPAEVRSGGDSPDVYGG